MNFLALFFTIHYQTQKSVLLIHQYLSCWVFDGTALCQKKKWRLNRTECTLNAPDLNARQITMSLFLQCSRGRSAGEEGTVLHLFISLATNQKLPSTRTPARLSISALGRWVAARQKSQERIKQEGGTDVREMGEGKEKKKQKPTTRGRDVREKAESE